MSLQFINNTEDDIAVNLASNDSASPGVCATLPLTATIPAKGTAMVPFCSNQYLISNSTSFTRRGITYTFPNTASTTRIRLISTGATGAQTDAGPPLYFSLNCHGPCLQASTADMTVTLSPSVGPKFTITANVPLLITIIVVICIGFCINAYIFLLLVRWMYHKL